MDTKQKLVFVALPLAVGALVPQAWNQSKSKDAKERCPVEYAGLTMCLDIYKDKAKCVDAEYTLVACTEKP